MLLDLTDDEFFAVRCLALLDVQANISGGDDPDAARLKFYAGKVSLKNKLQRPQNDPAITEPQEEHANGFTDKAAGNAARSPASGFRTRTAGFPGPTGNVSPRGDQQADSKSADQ